MVRTQLTLSLCSSPMIVQAAVINVLSVHEAIHIHGPILLIASDVGVVLQMVSSTCTLLYLTVTLLHVVHPDLV